MNSSWIFSLLSRTALAGGECSVSQQLQFRMDVRKRGKERITDEILYEVDNIGIPR
jgi:hypothetical protein